MKLACADFTWPLLGHEQVLKLIRLLDLDGVDLGLMGNRSHIRPEVVRQDIPMWAGIIRERLAQSGLELADLFVVPWTDFETMSPNNPDSKQQEDAAALFREMLDLGERIGTPGITILPGAVFGGESWDGAVRRAAEALKWRVEEAAARGMALSVEGHIGSVADTPEKLAHLVRLTPGLTLTLDYAHYTFQGFPDSEIEPLLAHARHFHMRGVARNRLQAKFKDNAVDYRRVIERLRELDYQGYLTLEYVWMDWQGCDETDNVCETIQFRDLARAAIAGREYTGIVKAI